MVEVSQAVKPSNERKPSVKSLRALDALNVFLAEVRDGVGPYLSVYLKASQGWDAAQIGLVLSASTIATVLAQTPAGALVDRLRQKRLLLVIASIAVSVGCLGIVFVPTLPSVLICQVLIGLAAAVFAPAIAAITLGLVGHRRLDRRIGRNETFNHAGNLLAASLAGAIGQFVTAKGIFFLVAAMAIGSSLSVLRIREREIDHELARGATDDDEPHDAGHHFAGLQQLFRDPHIRSFAIAVILFHFANAAMLPLVGQRLADGKGLDPTVYLSACIIVAQLVMIPASSLAGRLTEKGRKPIFLLAFAVLPVRGILYTFSNNPYFLVSVQLLDGFAGGIFGVLSVLMVADLTRGTGRFNLTQGLLSTAVGIGAGLSNILAGIVVQQAGYDAAFLLLAAIATIALAVFWFYVPETRSASHPNALQP